MVQALALGQKKVSVSCPTVGRKVVLIYYIMIIIFY